MGQKDCGLSLIKKPCVKYPFNCNRCQTKLKNGGKVWRATVPDVSGYYIELSGFSLNLEYDNSAELNAHYNNLDYGSDGLNYQGEQSIFPDRPPEFVANAEGYKPCFSGLSENPSGRVTTSPTAIADFDAAAVASSFDTWEDHGGNSLSGWAMNVAHYYGEGWRVLFSATVLGRHDTLSTLFGFTGVALYVFSSVYKSSVNRCFIDENTRFSRTSVGFNILSYALPTFSYLDDITDPTTPEGNPFAYPDYGNDIAAVAEEQVPAYIDLRHVNI